MADSPPQTLTRELAVSHADFYRLITTTVTEPDRVQINRNQAQLAVSFGGGAILILLEPEGMRTLGSLRLPVTRIHFEFQRLTRARIADYLTRFDRSFHRGGG